MEIIINAEAKEIAALVEELKERRDIYWEQNETGIKDLANILLDRHDTKPEAPEISPN